VPFASLGILSTGEPFAQVGTTCGSGSSVTLPASTARSRRRSTSSSSALTTIPHVPSSSSIDAKAKWTASSQSMRPYCRPRTRWGLRQLSSHKTTLSQGSGVANRPSGSHAAPPPRRRRRARSTGKRGRSPRGAGVAPRPRRAARTPLKDEERLLVRLGVVKARLSGSRTVTLIPNWATRPAGRRTRSRRRTSRPPLREPPLGVAHVDDEPALADGREPRSDVLEPCSLRARTRFSQPG
jgi:hypothetical protein